MVYNLHDELTRFILDPAHAPLLAVVKAARNGIIYGSRIRLPHALVIVFLFRPGTIREKLCEVLDATRQHARNLAVFAAIYKLTLVGLNRCGSREERRYDTFVAGLVAGYVVFGRDQTSISQQIVIYIFARVALAMGKAAIQPRVHPLSPYITPEIRDKLSTHSWPVFASVSWASIMYLFRWYPDTIQSGLRSSMEYIYRDSDHWDSLRTMFLQNK